MLNEIIIIENENKIQCNSEKDVVKVLIADQYYELTPEEQFKKREIKAIANCINNHMKVVKEIDLEVESLENKFIIKDEITYVLSLLITNNIILLERIDSNIYTGSIDKSGMDGNYIIVNKYAKQLLESYLK